MCLGEAYSNEGARPPLVGRVWNMSHAIYGIYGDIYGDIYRDIHGIFQSIIRITGFHG